MNVLSSSLYPVVHFTPPYPNYCGFTQSTKIASDHNGHARAAMQIIEITGLFTVI